MPHILTLALAMVAVSVTSVRDDGAPDSLRSLSQKVDDLSGQVAQLRQVMASAGFDMGSSLPEDPPPSFTPSIPESDQESEPAVHCPANSPALLWQGGAGDAEHDDGRDWFRCVEPERTGGVASVNMPVGLHVYHGGASDIQPPYFDGWFAASRDHAIMYGRLADASGAKDVKVFNYVVNDGSARLALVTAANMRIFRDKLEGVTIGDVFGGAAFDGSDTFLAKQFEGFKEDMRWTVGKDAWVSDTGKPPLAKTRVTDGWVRSRHLGPLFYLAFDDSEEVRRDSRNNVDWVIVTALCRLFSSDKAFAGLDGWYGHNVEAAGDGKFADEVMLCKTAQHVLGLSSETPLSAYDKYTGYNSDDF